MTDYGSTSHQQMYDFVNSGSPSNVQSEADLSTDHGKSVTSATDDLQKTLSKIQSSWSGAAADQFSQQANSIVQQMQQHAQNADQVGSVMSYAGQYLTWAQQNMPSPPSEAEQMLADVNSNSVSEWGLGIVTGGSSYIASKEAQNDIAQKKAVATQVMTQLAGAYTQAQSQLSQRTGGNRRHRMVTVTATTTVTRTAPRAATGTAAPRAAQAARPAEA